MSQHRLASTPRDVHDEAFEMNPASATLVLQSPEKTQVRSPHWDRPVFESFHLRPQTLLKEQVFPVWISNRRVPEINNLLFYAIMFLDGFYVAIDKWNTVYGPLEKKEWLILIMYTYRIEQKNN